MLYQQTFYRTRQPLYRNQRVPKYQEFFDNDADLFENISHNSLNKNGYLYEEPALPLEKEVDTSITYFSILKAIAAALEMKNTILSPYLATLMDLHLIECRVPATEPTPEHSKKGRYHIQDIFLRFWFLFVSPNKSELEIGKTDAVLERIKPHFIDRFASFVYEDVCRELFWDLCTSKKFPLNPLVSVPSGDGEILRSISCQSTTQVRNCSPENANSMPRVGTWT